MINRLVLIRRINKLKDLKLRARLRNQTKKNKKLLIKEILSHSKTKIKINKKAYRHQNCNRM